VSPTERASAPATPTDGVARHRAPPGLLRSCLAELTDLLLRRECGGCGRTRTSWCADCAAALAGTPTSRHLLVPGRPGPLAVWSTAEYGDRVRAGIVAWKDRGRADLTPVLAQALRRAVVAAVQGTAVPDGLPADRGRPVLLVPAPSSRRSRHARGHDPARDLALRCANGLSRRGLAVAVLPALAQARRVQDQAGLGADERQQNLHGALRVVPGWAGHLAGRDCVVVDDVVTTGATLLDCVRALEEAGARVRAGATVAATRRRDGRRGPSALPPGAELA
jgi:predicted amidophosphoribosyltransferase